MEVKVYPDPCLRIKTKNVDKFDSDIAEILAEMTDVMYANQGIGLAATQVGLGLSLFVVETGKVSLALSILCSKMCQK